MSCSKKCAVCGEPIHYAARTMEAVQRWEHVGHSDHAAVAPAPQPQTAPDACPSRGPALGTACSLPSGHDGFHSDGHGGRWETAPDAEPGTPVADRERLREQYAAAMRAVSSRIDEDELADAVLAVRDDVLTTAQRDLRTAEHVARQNLDHYKRTYRAYQQLEAELAAARDRVTELEGTIHTAMIRMGVSPESTSGTGSPDLHTAYNLLRDAHRTALAPSGETTQDGGAS